jgi:hypothetical protein
MRGRNVTKPFSIAGFVLAEIYMLFTVLAPPKSARPCPSIIRYGAFFARQFSLDRWALWWAWVWGCSSARFCRNVEPPTTVNRLK